MRVRVCFNLFLLFNFPCILDILIGSLGVWCSLDNVQTVDQCANGEQNHLHRRHWPTGNWPLLFRRIRLSFEEEKKTSRK